jgi:hypothetical protein
MLSSVLLYRIWQAAAGLFTTVLVVHYLTPILQGWYYSLLSIASLYTLLDLGLSAVLVQVAAHTGVRLRWGAGHSCEGPDAPALIALLSRSVRWYLLLASIFIVIVCPVGYYFFVQRDALDVMWRWPWVLLCAVTGTNLLFIPFLSILEGAGKLGVVYGLRLTQAVLGAFACWCLLASGAQLWATSMVTLLAVIVGCIWLWLRGRSLVTDVWQQRHASYDWRQKIWPLQWRIAVGSVCGYLITQVNIPILFYIKGPELAGKFGLSLAVVNTLSLVCQSWFTRHVPLMAQAAVRRDWRLFDQVFYKDLKESVLFFLIAAALMLITYFIFIDSLIVSRLLSFWSFAGLLVFTFINLWVTAWATQLRSFCREPLLPLVLLSTILILPSVVLATYWYSINGMIVVLNATYLFVVLPFSWMIWRQFNFAWRRSA